MSRTFKYNILVDTMHVFDGFIVSSSEARDTSSHFLPHSLPTLHLPTWNLSMSMVVFSFLLDAAEKKTVENEHKVLQSRQVVSQYLTLAISLTQTLSLSICGSSGCLFYGHALEWLFITL